MSIYRICLLALLLAWVAGAFLHFDAFLELTGNREGFQPKVIRFFFLAVITTAGLYGFFQIIMRIDLLRKNFALVLQGLLGLAVLFVLIQDMPETKPRVYGFSIMPDQRIDSLRKSRMYVEMFGDFYQSREVLSGKTIIASDPDDIDPRFISLARMKYTQREDDIELPDVKSLEAIRQIYEVQEFLEGTYLLIYKDQEDYSQDFVLLNQDASEKYLIPEYIYNILHHPAFSGGSGTKNDPYLVTDVSHLNHIRYFPQSHFRQEKDIDFADDPSFEPKSFNPIGSNVLPFTGVFDGNGFTIRNLRIHKFGYKAVGLFGHIGKKGVVKNISLEDVDTDNSIYISREKLVGEWLYSVHPKNGHVPDSSGNGNNAANYNGHFYMDPLIGPVLAFDGLHDPRAKGGYLDLDFALEEPWDSEFTFSIWIKLNTLRSGGTILGAGHASGAYGLFENNQQILFGLRPYDADRSFVTFNPRKGTWHHVAGVYIPDKFLRLFVDGNLVGETIPVAGRLSETNLQVGHTGRISGSRAEGSFLDGKVSRISVYNRVLSSSEVKVLATIGIAGTIAGVNEGEIINAYASGTVKGIVANELAGVNLGQ
jgi:hypothetical protein